MAQLPLPDRDHIAIAVSIEYAKFFDTGAESTVIVEGQLILGYPDEPGVPAEAPVVLFAPPLFDNDILVGYRYAFNDEVDKNITATAIVDVLSPREFILNSAYSRRIGEAWGVKVVKIPPQDPQNPVGAEFLHNAHQLTAAFTRYF